MFILVLSRLDNDDPRSYEYVRKSSSVIELEEFLNSQLRSTYIEDGQEKCFKQGCFLEAYRRPVKAFKQGIFSIDELGLRPDDIIEVKDFTRFSTFELDYLGASYWIAASNILRAITVWVSCVSPETPFDLSSIDDLAIIRLHSRAAGNIIIDVDAVAHSAFSLTRLAEFKNDEHVIGCSEWP